MNILLILKAYSILNKWLLIKYNLNMETKEKKSIHYYMRSLHRDIGFLIIGFALIYSLSGIVLIYRDTDFLKQESKIEKKLSPDLQAADLGKALRMRNFEVQKTEGDIIYFQNGTYNSTTGVANYTEKQLPAFLEKLTNFHKAISKNLIHIFSLLFGFSFLFLAISSFWMFKPKSKMFRRGIIFAASGVILVVILLMII
jgi:hypothetical protein